MTQSIRLAFDARNALAREPWAGGILAIQVPQQGMVQPRMAFTPKRQADNDSNV